jgi:hypothetical protein
MEIEGFKNYLVYEDGKVYNQKYKNYLKHIINKQGYSTISLYVSKGKKKVLKIHRLVATYYCINEKPEEYNQVDHIDRDKLNNHKSNLRWCNSSINNSNRNPFKKLLS